jgi:hypothetical protein
MPSDYWERFEKTIDPRFDDTFRLLMRHAFYAGGVATSIIYQEVMEIGTPEAVALLDVAEKDLLVNSDATTTWIEANNHTGSVN